jgi:hypothetical protein
VDASPKRSITDPISLPRILILSPSEFDSEIPRDNERAKMKKSLISISLPDFFTPTLTAEDSTISSIRTSRFMKIRHSDPTVPPPPRKFRPALSSAGISRSRSAIFYRDVEPTPFSNMTVFTSDRILPSDSLKERNELLLIQDPEAQGRDLDPHQLNCSPLSQAGATEKQPRQHSAVDWDR